MSQQYLSSSQCKNPQQVFFPDARSLTDYRPISVVDEKLRKISGTTNPSEYRAFLQSNGNAIQAAMQKWSFDNAYIPLDYSCCVPRVNLTSPTSGTCRAPGKTSS